MTERKMIVYDRVCLIASYQHERSVLEADENVELHSDSDLHSVGIRILRGAG